MKKFVPFYFFILLLLAGCTGNPSGPTAAQIAGQSAKVYYEDLLKGDYGSFVDGRYQPHKIPKGYRDQLIDNAKMFVAQQNEAHKGIKSIKVNDAKADTLHHVANAFLSFTYGDGSKESVVVPMVESKGVWYLR